MTVCLLSISTVIAKSYLITVSLMFNGFSVQIVAFKLNVSDIALHHKVE